MPGWYFQWSDALKNRSCKFLLDRYLGQYFTEKLDLNQLSVEIYNGRGSVKDVTLDMGVLNEMAETHSLPIEFVDGYVERISIAIPWSGLFTKNTDLEVQGLMIIMRPKERGGNTSSLMDSLMNANMTSSIQIAKECMMDIQDDGSTSKFEGLEVFAETIDSVLRNVKITLLDTTLRLELVPRGSKTGVAVEIRTKRIEYSNEAGQQDIQPSDEERRRNLYEPAAFTCKNIKSEGITFHTDEFAAACRTEMKPKSPEDLVTPDKCTQLPSDDSESSKRTSLPEQFYDARQRISPESMTAEAVPNLSIRSDPILIARISGTHEVRLRLKQLDTIPGPKVFVDCNIGSVVMFLSPRQLHVLLELLGGLISPAAESTVNTPSQSIPCSKPMQRSDFDHVQRVMVNQLGQNQVQPQPMWSSLTSETLSDEEFHTMAATDSNQMSESVVSDTSTQISDNDSLSSSYLGCSSLKKGNPDTCGVPSTASTFASAATKPNSGRRYQTEEPMGDITSCKFQLSSLVVTLLHEDILTPAVAGNGLVAQSSVLQMKAKAEAYFGALSPFTLTSTDGKDMADAHEKLSAACTSNHLRFISFPFTLEGSDKMSATTKNVSAVLTFGSAEFLECLFDKKSATSQPIPEYCKLFSFSNTEAKDTDGPSSFVNQAPLHQPSIKVKFNKSEPIPTYSLSRNRRTAALKPTVSVQLARCESEVDITIIDRISCLLNPQQLFGRLPQTAPAAQPLSSLGHLSQAMDEGATGSSKKIALSITSPFMTLNVRFPIPDLRPANDIDRAQWWNRNIRDDVLFLRFTDVRLSALLDVADPSPFKLDIRFQKLQSSFRENSMNPPISWLSICPGDDSGPRSNLNDNEGFDYPRIIVKIGRAAPLITVEEQEMEDSDDAAAGAHPWEQGLMSELMSQDTYTDPTPFSTRHVMYHCNQSSGGRDSNSQRPADDRAKGEQVLPKERAEAAEFIDLSIANSQYVIELSCNNAHIVFPSKHFYEVLYNRITTDLLLWEPTAPVPAHKETRNIRQSNVDLNWAHMQETMNPRFSMGHSVLRFDSSSDSEEENSYFGFDEAKQKLKKTKSMADKVGRQNKFSFLLTSKNTVLTVKPPLRDASMRVIPEYCGELQVHLLDSTFFAVSKAPGSAESAYMCLQINRANVFHKGVLKYPAFEHSDIGPARLSAPANLDATLYPTERGALVKPREIIRGELADALLMAARVSLDPVRNVKTFCVTIAVRGCTLRHRVLADCEDWTTQFKDFFDVVDYPVLGYRQPEVLTELHAHLMACSIDYRPLYSPIRAFLAADTFSLSCNIAPQTSTKIISVIVEDAYLFLSRKCNTPTVNLKKNYVCVSDLSYLELFSRSTKVREQKQILQPYDDMQGSSGILRVMTCTDSLLGLHEIIVCFAVNADLRMKQRSDTNPNDFELESTLSSLQSEGVSPGSCCSEEQVPGLMAEAMRESPRESPSSSVIRGVRASPESTVSSSDRVILLPDATRECSRLSGLSRKMTSDPVTVYGGGSRPSTIQGFDISDDDEDECSTDDDFCILENDPGVGIVPRTGEPQIRCLRSEPIVVKENHFQVPIGRGDQLKAPKHFPTPVSRYILRELSVVFYMYGGNDFSTESDSAPAKSSSPMDRDSHLWEKDEKEYMSDYYQRPGNLPALEVGGVTFNKFRKNPVRFLPSSPSSCHATRGSDGLGLNWQKSGGPGRLNKMCVELHLNKIRFQHEVYPEDTFQSSRSVLLVHEVEIRDRLETSALNKFLYQDTSENMPRQSQANMFELKVLLVRPDLNRPNLVEGILSASLMPLRFNIDQETLFFISTFCQSLVSGGSAGGDGASPDDAGDLSDSPRSGVRFGSTDSSRGGVRPSPRHHHTLPVRTVVGSSPPASLPCDSSSALSRSPSSDSQTPPMLEDDVSPRVGQPIDNVPIFFRSFTFARDVPIRIDYQGKRVDMEQGALAGLIMGLGQLNGSELRLKRLSYKHGLLGWDKVMNYALNSWMQDIKQTQIPGLLGGVGPLHSFVQLVQGVRDLILMPIEQYRKDGRIVRGLQRGANSFTTSTAMAALELTNRLVQMVQYTAETAYDVVSPGPSVRARASGSGGVMRKRMSQPADIREGLTNAYNVVCEGLGDTARTLVQVASEEHEHKGITGAVGGVLRQIPSTMVKPIILATEATSNVLGGVQCQIAPHKHKEEQSKFRSTMSGDSM